MLRETLLFPTAKVYNHAANNELTSGIVGISSYKKGRKSKVLCDGYVTLGGIKKRFSFSLKYNTLLTNYYTTLYFLFSK